MALSKWAEALVPVLAQRLPSMGVNPDNAPIFAAQLDLETGGGTSSLSKRKNNYAGIGGLGNYRTYGSPAEGVQGYLDLLERSRHYKSVLEAGRTGGINEVAKALGNSPWAAGRYRTGVAGDEDVRGVKAHADGTWGTVGTEGDALLNKLGGVRRGPSDWHPGGAPQATPQVDHQAVGRYVYGQMVGQGLDPAKYNLVIQGGKAYVIPKAVA